MESFDNCSYVVECTPDGTYYAYLLDSRQCCAYGETAEEALDNLAAVAEYFFGEVSSVYYLEDYA